MLTRNQKTKDILTEKVLVIGDKKVGKSTLIQYLKGSNFLLEHEDATRDNFLTKTENKTSPVVAYAYHESTLDRTVLERIDLNDFKCILVMINETDMYANRGQEFVDKLRNINKLLVHKNCLIIINKATRSLAQVQKKALDLYENEADTLEQQDIIVVHPEDIETRKSIHDAILRKVIYFTPAEQASLNVLPKFQLPSVSEAGLGAASMVLGGFLLAEGNNEENGQDEYARYVRYASAPFLMFGAYALSKSLGRVGEKTVEGIVHALEKHGFAVIQGIIEKGAVSANIEEGAFNFEACIREGAISAKLEPNAIMAAIQEGAIVGVQKGGIWAGMEAGAAKAGVSPGAFNAWIEKGAVDAGIKPGAVKAWVEKGAVDAKAWVEKGAVKGKAEGRICVLL